MVAVDGGFSVHQHKFPLAMFRCRRTRRFPPSSAALHSRRALSCAGQPQSSGPWSAGVPPLLAPQRRKPQPSLTARLLR